VVERAIKPDDPHYARSRLLCLENTWHGRPLPLDYLAAARALCDRRGLAFHLDGARLYNAAAALGVPVRRIAAHFDSVSVCLSKGLGAPVGSVLLGSRTLIDEARRWRKVTGGGMRQAGILAAGALHALDHHVARLADDHARAAALGDALHGLPGLEVAAQHSNMVFLSVPVERHAALGSCMDQARVRLSIGDVPDIRLVTHLDIDDAALARTIAAFRAFAGA
jgi:threonine aldolase